MTLPTATRDLNPSLPHLIRTCTYGMAIMLRVGDGLFSHLAMLLIHVYNFKYMFFTLLQLDYLSM